MSRGKRTPPDLIPKLKLALLQDGASTRSVADDFGLSHVTVYRLTGGKKRVMQEFQDFLGDDDEPPKRRKGKRKA